jgi:hypothetical protein
MAHFIAPNGEEDVSDIEYARHSKISYELIVVSVEL